MKWIKTPQLPEGYRENTILVKRRDGHRMLLAYNGAESNTRWLMTVEEWLDESESIPSVTNEEDELWNTVVAKIAAYDIMSKTRPGNTKQIEEWKQKAIIELKASYTINRKPSSLHS